MVKCTFTHLSDAPGQVPVFSTASSFTKKIKSNMKLNIENAKGCRHIFSPLTIRV